MDLGAPGRPRRYSAVVNGGRASVTGPAGLVRTVRLPAGTGLGCALLPEGLAYGKLAGVGARLAADAAGRPLRLAWSVRGQAATLAWADYRSAAGLAYAATVTETVGGETRLAVHFDSVAPHSFNDSDFALPPPNPVPARAAGGGR